MRDARDIATVGLADELQQNGTVGDLIITLCDADAHTCATKAEVLGLMSPYYPDGGGRKVRWVGKYINMKPSFKPSPQVIALDPETAYALSAELRTIWHRGGLSQDGNAAWGKLDALLVAWEKGQGQ